MKLQLSLCVVPLDEAKNSFSNFKTPKKPIRVGTSPGLDLEPTIILFRHENVD